MDIEQIRADFPILKTKVYGRPLIYLDNGATTQKPNRVIDAICDYYSSYNSNVHRGVHYLSQRATDAEEQARADIAAFINAPASANIVFTKGTTDGINLVASSFCAANINTGDAVLVTAMEHHSNLVPWQIQTERCGGKVKYIPIDAEGNLILNGLDGLLSPEVKLLAFTWVSNTLGTINDAAMLVAAAHAKGIPVLIDAAQAIHHLPIDVQALDVDFLVFSGHKMYGPTGIGVLYGKLDALNALPPYQGGGSMINDVQLGASTYAASPFRFEAGTPNVAGIIGLGAAVGYLKDIGWDYIQEHEAKLMRHARAQLATIPGIKFIGDAKKRSGVISINVAGTHPYDLGELMDKQGVAVRTGHHCCQPIMDQYGIPGTLRLSFGIYNTLDEVDAAVAALGKAVAMLR